MMQPTATDHARSSRVRRLLYRRDARVDSAEQFGFLAGLVLEEWHRCPGLRSSAEAVLEVAQLGTIVQTSLELPPPPSLAYHVDWIVSVLYAARQAAAVSHARRKRRDQPNARDQELADELIQIWSQVDIHLDTQRLVAGRWGLSAATVSRRVSDARQYVHRSLREHNRLSV